jgi:hypothetical protein
MNTQLILSNTLSIKHYQNKYNPNKVTLVKRSPAGHYFVNQLISESLAYPKFKRVSGKTLHDTILADSFEVDMIGFKAVMALSVAECLLSSTRPQMHYKRIFEYKTNKEAMKYYALGWSYLKEFNDSGLYKDDIDKLYLYSSITDSENQKSEVSK